MSKVSLVTSGTRWLIIAVVLGLAWLLAERYLWWQPGAGNAREEGGSELIAFLSGPSEGEFAPVVPGAALKFPADHGAHPGFRQEWWYFTGRVETAEGRPFGYQLTFFRFAADSPEFTPDSAWSTDQTWMAHLAITDVTGNRFEAREDFARQSLALAGANADPLAVWVNGWSVRAMAEPPDCTGCFYARVSADAGDISLDFEIRTTRPPVLQGDAGYSRKTADGRAASYYYSMPAIETRGVLRVAGESWEVSGETWMDREWSSAVLAPGQSGWDWFSLNLDNGVKLMIFQVRDGTASPYRYVATLDAGWNLTPLDGSGLALISGRTWKSPHSGGRYPIEWTVTGISPDSGWSLHLQPVIDDQEVNLSFRYYEGMVRVSGQWQGREVSGWGYMELTGYIDH